MEEIAGETSVSIANASQHLQVLKSNNLVEIRRQGNFIYYRLAHDEIYKCLQTFRQLGLEHLAEMEKLVKDFREQRNSLEAVDMDELISRMKSKKLCCWMYARKKNLTTAIFPALSVLPLLTFLHASKSCQKIKNMLPIAAALFAYLPMRLFNCSQSMDLK